MTHPIKSSNLKNDTLHPVWTAINKEKKLQKIILLQIHSDYIYIEKGDIIYIK